MIRFWSANLGEEDRALKKRPSCITWKEYVYLIASGSFIYSSLILSFIFTFINLIQHYQYSWACPLLIAYAISIEENWVKVSTAEDLLLPLSFKLCMLMRPTGLSHRLDSTKTNTVITHFPSLTWELQEISQH